jgi:hypothetical protein
VSLNGHSIVAVADRVPLAPKPRGENSDPPIVFIPETGLEVDGVRLLSAVVGCMFNGLIRSGSSCGDFFDDTREGFSRGSDTRTPVYTGGGDCTCGGTEKSRCGFLDLTHDFAEGSDEVLLGPEVSSPPLVACFSLMSNLLLCLHGIDRREVRTPKKPDNFFRGNQRNARLCRCCGSALLLKVTCRSSIVDCDCSMSVISVPDTELRIG